MTTETTDPLAVERWRLHHNLMAAWDVRLGRSFVEVNAYMKRRHNSPKERLIRLAMQPLWWCIKNSQPHTQELFYEAEVMDGRDD